MSTELSFGYLNALAIGERVIDRLVGALYDGQEIQDAGAHEISAGLVAHTFFSKPRVSFDATQPGCNVVLTIDDLQILSPLAEVPASRGLEVQFPLVVDRDTQVLRCDFSAVTMETVTAVTPDGEPDPVTAALVVYALTQGGFMDDLPFSFIGGSNELLGCDMLHVRTLNDPGGEDQGTLNAGLWDSHGTEGPGAPENITSFLEEGKSFTLRVSSSGFDRLVGVALDDRFMCFDLRVPEEEQTDNGVRIVPGAGGVVTLEGQPDDDRASISGTIHNTRRASTDRVDFSCDSEGAFTATIEAQAGDRLEIRGTQVTLSFEEYSAVLYRPSIVLCDGYVNLRCRLDVEEPVTVQPDIDTQIRLEVDLATGHLVTETEADVELPWWADLILACMGESINGTVADLVDDEFGRLGVNLVPTLGNSEHMAVFWEEIEVREDGLILTGQIEAGLIVSAGRTTELSFDMGAGHRVTFDPEGATLAVSHAMVADLAMTRTFEELDFDSLARHLYRHTRLTLPAREHWDGRVFAVRGLSNFGKMRLNMLHDGRPLLRWVLYQPPILPEVELVGQWHQDPGPFSMGLHGFRFESSGASRYWGEFTVELHGRLYDPEPGTGGEPDIRWNPYHGPGEFTILENGRTVSIDIDTEAMAEETFEIDLRVAVTDVFGRSAFAHRLLTGSKLHRWLIRPDVEKEPHLEVPPREPTEVEIVTPDQEHPGNEKRIPISEAKVEELEQYYSASAQATVQIGEELGRRARSQVG